MEDLTKTHPNLIKEWDYSKNTILPTDVSFGSAKKVFWICPKGHSYEASVCSRASQNTGCPYCANQKVLAGYNDLATTHPNLLKEWDYNKNKDLPSTVFAGSHKKYYWICPKGHSYVASLVRRKNGQGCPYCSNKKILVGINDFESLYPNLAKEWDFDKNSLKPSDYFPTSNKKVYWICSLGHSYKAVISKRTISNQSCPICAGRRVLQGFNDLATTHPNLIKEWDYNKNTILPTEVTHGSDKKIYWICKYGHSWKSTISSRVSNTGCPICAKGSQTSFPEKVITFYLKKAFSEVYSNYFPAFMNGLELDIYIPSINVAIEYDGEKWHTDAKKDIKKDNIAKENGIILYRIREPKCPNIESSSKIITLDNKKVLAPAIEKLFNHLADDGFLEQAKIPKINIEIDRSLIFSESNFCEAKNSIENSSFVNEWDYERNKNIYPYMFSKYSSKKVYWLCKLNHSYEASISDRSSGKGCPICAGKKILAGFNDLASLHPELLCEWDYDSNTIKPTEIGAGSDKKVYWKCAKGHSYEMSVGNKVYQHLKCPYCSNKRILKGFNDLATLRPDLEKDWDYAKNTISPSEISLGSHKKVYWKCAKCGHTWITMVFNRTTHKSGCPKCAIRHRNEKE